MEATRKHRTHKTRRQTKRHTLIPKERGVRGESERARERGERGERRERLNLNKVDGAGDDRGGNVVDALLRQEDLE